MKGSLVKSAVVGAVIVFIWGMFSWMVLPWHKMNYHTFQNGEHVSRVILDNVSGSGIYSNMSCGKIESGPFISAVVKMEGIDYSSLKPNISAFILLLIAGYVISYLVSKTKGLSYQGKVGFIALVGLSAGLIGNFPAWVWGGYPFTWAFVCLLDHVIGWGLAGFAMAKILKK